MRSNGKAMGTDNEKGDHHLGSENLKSLLKKSDNKVKKNHRVIFNENKNEFFDADYIILIREECDYDEEDDGICTCNQQQETINLACEPIYSCKVYDEADRVPQSPKFTPPYDFVDTTISPPEGYKDMEMEELFVLQKIIHPTQRTTVCRDCRINSDADKDVQSDYKSEAGTNGTIEREKVDQYQQTTPTTPPTNADIQQYIEEISNSSSDAKDNNWKKDTENFKHLNTGENENKETVQFAESNGKEKYCDEESDNNLDNKDNKPKNPMDSDVMLTFKLGNHLLMSNNSLKPNSAVRQLFPYSIPSLAKGDNQGDSSDKYLITAESLRAFEESKRSKLPQFSLDENTNENIKRVIERNTLRRSFNRYESKEKRNVQKSDNSLVELIKQLTCNVDDDVENKQYEETQTNLADYGIDSSDVSSDMNKCNKTYSPSSSSSASSSSSNNSTYKRMSDVFNKREKARMQNDAMQQKFGSDESCELCAEILDSNKVTTNEGKNQFSSTFTPLPACMGNMEYSEDSYINSTIYSAYSLVGEQPDKKDEMKNITPDVLAGTPVSSESKQELALIADHDRSKIKGDVHKYQPDHHDDEEDEENDDYGFHQRPNVQSIKPQFDTTLLHQNKATSASSTSVVWPYYSESGLTKHDYVSSRRNVNETYQYLVPKEIRGREFADPNVKQNEGVYQKCPKQSFFEAIYKSNLCAYSVDINHRNSDKSISRTTYNKPLSPPPQDIRNCHQTMVYIPYSPVDRYQLSPNLYHSTDTFKVSNRNQINNEYTGPIYNHLGYFCPLQNPNLLSFSQKNNTAFPTHQHVSTVSSNQSTSFGPNFSARSTQTSSTLSRYTSQNDIGSKRDIRTCYSDDEGSKIGFDPSIHREDNCINYNAHLRNKCTQSLEVNSYISQ